MLRRARPSAEDHPRVDQVIERVRAGGLSISTQAAYDVCEALRAQGLARRIAPAGGPARYEARVGDNHHHLVCRACGATVDVDCAVGGRAVPRALGRRPASTVDEAEVDLLGALPQLPDQQHIRGGPRMSEGATQGPAASEATVPS